MTTKIKFGTDGWRAIIADDYTVANVARVAKATADWLNQNSDAPSLVLGYDCRFGGRLFAETVIKVMCHEKVKVFFDKHFVSTPMVSLGAKYLNCDAGVIITASHNPPDYNGYKIKSGHGGPAIPKSIAEVEALIPDTYDMPDLTIEELEKYELLEYTDLETIYYRHTKNYFDLEAMRNIDFKVGYDAMYGAGQNIMHRLLPEVADLHCEYNPSFHGQAPEPIHKNLLEFSNMIKNDVSIQLGIATDGDADRIGLYDADGHFIDAHHIILLLIHILHKKQGMSGKVVVAFSVSDKVKKMCDAYGLEVIVTPVGFKHICEIMVKEDVLVGGEESGGIAVKGHIPERDGIWDGLVILQEMVKSGKTLQQLIDEVYAVVGPFSYNRNDLHITNELKGQIMENCKAGKYIGFGSYKVEHMADLDGYKFKLNNDACLMIRPSGTEPVLRVYGEAPSAEEVEKLLGMARETLLG